MTDVTSESVKLNIHIKLNAKGNAILDMKVAENINDGPSVWS